MAEVADDLTGKKVWIILDHPWQMFLVLGLRLASPGNIKYGLIISKHQYWKLVDINAYRPYFEEILFFNEPIRAHSLRGAFSFVKDIIELKKAIKKLPIRKEDILITVSYLKYVENFVTDRFRNNKQIFLCRHDLYKRVSMDFWNILRLKDCQITKSGYLHYLFLDRLLGIKKRTVNYWRSGKEQTNNTVYTKPLEKLYDVVFVARSPLALTSLNSNEFYLPYSLLRETPKTHGGGKVVFFLSGPIRNDNYYPKVNRILTTLKTLYGRQALLELRLHPNHPDEHKQINSEGWTVNNERGNSEQYLLRHASEIIIAASHVSTSVMFAANIGIQSYTYYKCFGFSENFTEIYDGIYEEMPREFFMESLDAEPKKFNTFLADPEAIKTSLNRIYRKL